MLRINPPYSVILDELQRGNVVPFLGAGASIVGRSDDTEWSSGSDFPPRGSELSKLLALKSEFDSSDSRDVSDLLKVATFYEWSIGRNLLRGQLHAVLGRTYQPGPLHRLLASIEGLKLIVTTNYDTILERAFQEANRPFDLVVYPSDSDETGGAILHWPSGSDAARPVPACDLDIDLNNQTVIFKMHGTVDDRSVPAALYDNFVITEDDYVEFLSRMTAGTAVPNMIIKHFRKRHFLFLGYSLSDWNMRVVLRNLGREFDAYSRRAQPEGESQARGAFSDEVKHWAIQDEPSPVEQAMWELRGVNIYNNRIDTVVEKLTKARNAA